MHIVDERMATREINDKNNNKNNDNNKIKTEPKVKYVFVVILIALCDYFSSFVILGHVSWANTIFSKKKKIESKSERKIKLIRINEN